MPFLKKGHKNSGSDQLVKQKLKNKFNKALDVSRFSTECAIDTAKLYI